MIQPHGIDANLWAIVPFAAMVWLITRGDALRDLGPLALIAGGVAGWFALFAGTSAAAGVFVPSGALSRALGFLASVAIVVPFARVVMSRRAVVVEIDREPGDEPMRRAV